MSNTDNCITNGLEINESAAGAATILAANNDEKVRVLDVARTTVAQEIDMEWAVNSVSMNPCNRCVPLSVLLSCSNSPSWSSTRCR